jgi:hypothetical protein
MGLVIKIFQPIRKKLYISSNKILILIAFNQ